MANIRPQFRSTLKVIFVVCVGRYEDISSYGLDAFLEPFVDDLKTLYVDGVTAEIGGEICTFYGGLLAFWQITWQHIQLVVISEVVRLL